MRGQAHWFTLTVFLAEREHTLKLYIYENGEILLDTLPSHEPDPDVLEFIETLSQKIQHFIRSDARLEQRPPYNHLGRISPLSKTFDCYLFSWSRPCPSWILEMLARSFTLTLMASGLLSIEEVRNTSIGQISALSAGLVAAMLPDSWGRLRTLTTSISLMSTVFGASRAFLMTLMTLVATQMNLLDSFTSQLKIIQWIVKGIGIALALAAHFQPSSKMLMGLFLSAATAFTRASHPAFDARSYSELQHALQQLRDTALNKMGLQILGKKAKEEHSDDAPHTVIPPKASTAIMRVLSQSTSMAAKVGLLGFSVDLVMASIAAATLFSLIHYLVDVEIDFFGKTLPPLSEKAPRFAWAVKAVSEGAELALAGASATLNMSMICATVLLLCQTSMESSLKTGLPSAFISGVFGLGVMFMVAYLRGNYSINPFGAGTQGAIQDAVKQTEYQATRTFLGGAAIDCLSKMSELSI